MSEPKTVIECTLRGVDIPCSICGHLPPDYCGQMELPLEASEETTDGDEEAEGTDATDNTETPVRKPRKKRTVAG